VLVICAGTACHVRNSAAVLQEACRLLEVQPGQTTADGAFTVEPVNCLGACALGPVAVLDGKVHPRMNPAKLRKLVQAARKLEKEAVYA
jgi:NADH-quinone oxidoreductase subunit E